MCGRREESRAAERTGRVAARPARDGRFRSINRSIVLWNSVCRFGSSLLFKVRFISPLFSSSSF